MNKPQDRNFPFPHDGLNGDIRFSSSHKQHWFMRPISILFTIFMALFCPFILFGVIIPSLEDDTINSNFLYLLHITTTWSAIAFVTLALLIFLKAIYRLIRGSTPETLTLNKPTLTFDDGLPPITVGFFFIRPSDQKKFRKALYHKRRSYTFTLEQLQTLALRKTGNGTRMTIDQGRNRIEFFTTASDDQRKWLLTHLNEHYELGL